MYTQNKGSEDILIRDNDRTPSKNPQSDIVFGFV